MQFSSRGLYWLLASPWALGRQTGVVEREPHANDVWLQLRLWPRSRPPTVPIAHAQVSLLLPFLIHRGQLSLSTCVHRLPLLFAAPRQPSLLDSTSQFLLNRHIATDQKFPNTSVLFTNPHEYVHCNPTLSAHADCLQPS